MPDQNLTAHTITGTVDHGLPSVDIATLVSDTRANATWKAFVAANDTGISGGLRRNPHMRRLRSTPDSKAFNSSISTPSIECQRTCKAQRRGADIQSGAMEGEALSQAGECEPPAGV